MTKKLRPASLASSENARPRPSVSRLSGRRIGADILALATAGSLAVTGLPAATAAEPEAMTQERVDAANNAYNDVATVLEFISMSDPEFSGSATTDKTTEDVAYEAAIPHFTRVADWASAIGFSVEAVVANGDVVGANEPEYNAHQAGNSERPAGWYRATERIMRESFPDAHVLLPHGNHDIADLMGDVLAEQREGRTPEWFFPRAEDNYVSNFHATINGIDFIGLDYNGAATFGYTNQRTGYQQFLRDTLASIEAAPDYDASKPIFVYIHSGFGGTSLGGPFRGVWDIAGPDLQTILSGYPQAVLGSAHAHFSSHPETSIYQKDFTVYEPGSMNYIYQDVPGDFLGGGYFSGNQGDPANGVSQKSVTFVSVLETGETVIRRYDVTQDRWIGMPWVIDASQGVAGFTYTDALRSTIAPWWSADAAITASEVTETSATLGFTHALDDELVNYYEISIADRAGNPVSFTANQVPDFGNNAPRSFTGSFKAYSRFFMTPNTMGFDIAGLEAATRYQVSVTAFDDFQNESEVLTGEFRTAGTLTFPEFPEDPTPPPAGAFLSMDFEGDLADDGTAADSAPIPATVGNVTFVPSGRPGATDLVARIGGGNGSFINLGQRPEYDLGTESDISIAFWANVVPNSGYGAILSNKNWANWYRAGINVAPQLTNMSKLEFTLGDGTNGVYVTGDVANYGNSWHHMAFTVNRETNIARTYMDGVLVRENSIASVGSMTSGLDMVIGTDGSRLYPTALDIDELRMWTNTLTPDEIRRIYMDGSNAEAIAALNGAIAYAEDLLEILSIDAANGRVVDETLTAAVEQAIADAELVLGETEPEWAALSAAYEALRVAVEAAEAQPVEYLFQAEALNGSISPESGVVELGADLAFTLTPAEGHQIADSTVTVSGAENYLLEGNVLTVQGATGPVSVAVAFAAVDVPDVGDGTGDGTDGTGDGTGTGNNGSGSGTGTLTETGSASVSGLWIAGLGVMSLGAAALLWFAGNRMRSRENELTA